MAKKQNTNKLSSTCRSGYLGLLVIFVLFAVLGCSGSSNDIPLKEQFPTLAKHAGIEEHEFEILLNSKFELVGDAAYPINTKGIKDMTIGSKVNSASSSYLPNPVFDLSLVSKNNLFDQNLNSSTVSITEINMSSKSDANQESGEFAESAKASFGTAFFKASVAQNYDHKYQNTNSSMSVNITMSTTNKGAYVQLLVSNFSGNNDFSSYLIGSKLDDATINSYVDFVRTAIPGKTDQYISALKINNKGQLTVTDNIYGNMQLLKKMEDGFYELKTTYSKYYSDTSVSQTIKDQMLSNLKDLRRYISLAIRNFYALHGDSFVSRINLMNYGYGKGVLKFDNQSGITSTQWGFAASASYQGASAGGSGSVSIQQASQSGWATQIKNSDVTAVSFPIGVIDTTAWANSIKTMLSQDQAISVPPLNLPAMAAITLPDPMGPKKDPTTPPDSCFSNYDDWKRYQDDKKKGGADQPKQQAQQGQDKVEQKGIQQALNDGNVDGVDNSQPEQGLYERYKAELAMLKDIKTKRSNKSQSIFGFLKNGGTNIMRVDKMFVSGFEATSYDRVLAQLRPDLIIPNEAPDSLNGYPNVAMLIYTMGVLGDLDNYLRLMTIYSISGVTKDMSANFKTFYDNLVNDAYSMIGVQLMNGSDVTNPLLKSFGITKFGTDSDITNSDLYNAFKGDSNAVQYVLYLLKPENVKVWRSSPGGYVPLGWNNNNLAFFNPYNVGQTSQRWSLDSQYAISYDKRNYSSYGYNPIDFYDNSIYSDNKYKSYKTPWFAIYRYIPAKDPNLIFLQNIGAYQLIIGPKYAFMASPNYAPYGKVMYINYSLNNSDPAFKVINMPVFDALTNKYFNEDGNGFNSAISWDYALYFDNLPQGMLNQFNALTLRLDTDSTQSFQSVGGYYYLLNPRLPLNDYFTGWQAAGAKRAYDMKYNVVNLKDKYSSSKAVIQLLPLNALTTNNRFNSAFTYSSNSKATDIIGNDSFNSSYKMTLFNY